MSLQRKLLVKSPTIQLKGSTGLEPAWIQEAAGLFEELLEIIHPGGQATRVLDKDGNVLLNELDDGTGGRPEVPRGELPDDSLPFVAIWYGAMVALCALIGARLGTRLLRW